MASMAVAAVMATLAAVSPARGQDIPSFPSCSYSVGNLFAPSRSPATATHTTGVGAFSSARSFCDGASLSLRQQCASRGSRSSQRQQLLVMAKEGDEISYVMVKPDGVQRGLVGEIISRFERKGFKLKGLKLIRTQQDLAEEHYAELKERPFFGKLVRYIVSGPVVAMAWEGPGVVASARKLIGVTNPLQAEPGTIRGDFGVEVGRNVVHGSDSPENGKREVALWFKEDELVEWDPELTPWLRE